jgi:hypothetical protein
MGAGWHFPILILVSFVVFIGILWTVLRRRIERVRTVTVLWVAAVVVIGGMAFARLGTSLGLPVWLYYGVPAVVTWVLPPLVFRMRRSEIVRYVPLAILVAPIIHVLFSLLFGWKEYMPFIPVPSLGELRRSGLV